MFGMGLSLTRNDFQQLWRAPLPIVVGLFGQMMLLPALAYALAIVFDLAPNLAIGIMILAACPGGTSSNIISQLARANLALSVSLTAISSLICVLTTPLIIQFAIMQFGQQEEQSFSLLTTTLGLIFITLIPVIIGIIIRHYFAEKALRCEPFFRHLASAFLLLMIVAIVIQERDTLTSSFAAVFSSALTLNLLAIMTGIGLGLLFKFTPRDSITLGIEVGVQNSAMAILIAITFLQRADYAVAPGVYGVTMYIGALLLVLLAKKYR
ncbi:bile acid:Na+ symporter, BASS family [Paraglaciecola mesophila KMM 241]|uniref:Bile acid:Na+ symporter, BASS family n=2 Tax=Paraglaciecola mesophila TaxID=197222 RepID=K6ZGX3_9ALTE|nr:bile acid:Na+ symporter, BASS family [Paraglaciecola mesophila KMM 241]|tara:strand:+ start:5910 stop:6710 length:801 start_codon:yes stop_codon:yes gene_type:complete